MSTGDEVGKSWWKQELVIELTGLQVQLKLRRETVFEIEHALEVNLSRT